MERTNRRRRLLLARTAVAAAAATTATLTTLVDGSNPDAPIDDMGANTRDAGIGPASPSTLRELQRVSTDLQTIGERDLWSDDAREALHSLEQRERRRLTERDDDARINNGDGSVKRHNLRRRGLSPKTAAEERYPERRLGRGVGMRRGDPPAYQPPWRGGGKSHKSNKSAKTSSADRKHYVIVDWVAPPPVPVPPSPPAYHGWYGGWHGGHVVEYDEHEEDDDDDDWHHRGGWAAAPRGYIEECYDVDEWGHVVWVPDGGGEWTAPATPDEDDYAADEEEEEEDDEEEDGEGGEDKYDVGTRNIVGSRWDGESGRRPRERTDDADEDDEEHARGEVQTDRWDGDTGRGDGRTLQQYYYVTYGEGHESKSGKRDSKSGKTSKTWGSPSWWSPPSWTSPAHEASHSNDYGANGEAGRHYMTERDHHAVMVMPSPEWHGSKSAKAKSGKTKAGKACFVMREGDVGESYCGKNFDDASSQCATKCASHADCAWGETCFGGITDCAEAEGYCGVDADDASAQCASECAADGDCSGGESCFYNVTCAQPEEGYCGRDFETAASVCSPKCISDADCESDETCFVGPLVENYCMEGGDRYCYDPANADCGPKCNSDDDCSGRQSCLGGFAAELCSQFNGGGEPAETPTPTYSPTKAVAPPTKEPTKKPAQECPAGCNDCDPDAPLPCPPSNLKRMCDKHQRGASFLNCYEMCKPSFCCIHDSLSKTFAPSCAQEYKNCELYYPCYIIWWKLHDTIGPATYLRVEQDEPFFNGLTFDFLEKDFEKDETFFQQLFGHHFDGDDAPSDDTFENEENW